VLRISVRPLFWSLAHFSWICKNFWSIKPHLLDQISLALNSSPGFQGPMGSGSGRSGPNGNSLRIQILYWMQVELEGRALEPQLVV
jgi:hypothetical protein